MKILPSSTHWILPSFKPLVLEVHSNCSGEWALVFFDNTELSSRTRKNYCRTNCNYVTILKKRGTMTSLIVFLLSYKTTVFLQFEIFFFVNSDIFVLVAVFVCVL